MKAIVEPQQNIPIHLETDVLVVGGGPAGAAAAIAAARLGVKVTLMERYGFLGGLATGGYVLMIPNLNNGAGLAMGGILLEWMDRLSEHPGGILGPSKADAGVTEGPVFEKWKSIYACSCNGIINHSLRIDSEMGKVVLSEMMEEAGVKLLLHCWGSRAYMEDGQLRGVIFESKEGRRVVLAKTVVDASGEGDIFASAGAEFDNSIDPTVRNSNMGEPFRLAGCDYMRFHNWRAANKEECAAKIDKLKKEVAGFYLTLSLASRNDNIWVNNRIPDRHDLSVEDITAVECEVKRAIPKIISYLRAEIPGFEDAYLMDIASAVGARHSRRLKGLHQLTMEELKEGVKFPDRIAAIPAQHAFNGNKDETNIYIPYGSLVPEKLDGLIAAGRCLCADIKGHNWVNLIPISMATGEAAGVAAALSVTSGKTYRDLDVQEIQAQLIRQGVAL